MSLSDHASERLSRKAKRLDSRKRRGTLLHTVLKASLFPSLSSGFSIVPNCSKKSLTYRVFLVGCCCTRWALAVLHLRWRQSVRLLGSNLPMALPPPLVTLP